MIDLNGLKNVNDAFGHAAGDTLIKGTAIVISDIYGEKGHCYRIGGDEFVVIIDADKDSLNDYREKLKARIGDYNSVEKYKLSMAIGEASLKKENGDRNSISDWKMNADLAMYSDKDAFYKMKGRG